jgi:feruloyl esterase
MSLILVGVAQGQSAETSGARCTGLAGIRLADAQVTSAAVIPAGGLTDLESKPLAASSPAFCRVRITDKPSADSNILTEVWLPLSGWNGRYRGIGNGGFAGSIYFDQMASALRQGFATSGTDAGHEGMDGGFALGHPEKVKDFGWRAVHDAAVDAKLLVAAYYGKPAAHSYFTACSDGGREALMEAQRFPEDYDGILAGAPAYNWTALIASGGVDEKVLHASAASNIPVSKLPAIGRAVRAACDRLDGVEDGVISDPRACHFDPMTLLCEQGDAEDCLTAEQVNSLKTIYSPKLDAAGKTIFPGHVPGSEDAQGGWTGWLLGDPSATVFFVTGYFADFVHADPAWKLSSFNLDSDFRLATEKTAAALNSTDPNLKRFADRGGKLIVYHGWSDPAITALSSIDYYNNVRAAMGWAAEDAALRLYLVPSMVHCDGGPGATDIGQSGVNLAPGDAEHDVFTALEQWVERSAAPGTLIAKGNGLTRPICVWPAVATYQGGDTKDARSFRCAVPKPKP